MNTILISVVFFVVFFVAGYLVTSAMGNNRR